MESSADSEVPGSSGSLRKKVGLFINSQKLLILVMALVIVDCVVVITELAIDLAIVKLRASMAFIPLALSYCSIFILGIFLIEILVRIYVMRLSFFSHKMEVFDAAVVVISFTLDLTFRHGDGAAVGVGLVIILRLWRVTRIINGIIRSVQTQAKQEIQRERLHSKELQRCIHKWQSYADKLEQEVVEMQGILRENNISFEAKIILRPGSKSTV